MLKKIYTFLGLLISVSASAQLGGEHTYQFLNLVSSPRQAALGGKVVTNVDYDISQFLYNPATINQEMDNQVSLNYSSYLGGISYGTASYGYTWDRHVQTFAIGVNYINYGSFDGYDEQGNQTGSFSGNETAITLGYARQLGYSDFYFGANLKFITSKLEQYNSFGMAADLGLIYRNEERRFNMALVLRNAGVQITTYAGQNEPLPLEVDLGLSQRLENVPIRWHLTFENLQKWQIAESNPARATTDLEGNQTQEEIGFFGQVIRHTIIGAELFPEGGFNLRFGYNFRRGEELRIVDQRNFSGFSAGFALKIKKLRFSYTHARYTNASNTNFFGLHIDLDK
ncbi:type IX secretion system protein PorQ [Mangrovimonas aestuarii]|uniref:type IX secretion system protein PorQ n=1 Tax=Mangrovimonas aestuarii TaxID=3018443 RepID=UPI00237934BA|nr:type IX secretion system protein PorQ [Mangrovimonas aestuarii]